MTSCSLRLSGVSESRKSCEFRESCESQSLRTMNCTIAEGVAGGAVVVGVGGGGVGGVAGEGGVAVQ